MQKIPKEYLLLFNAITDAEESLHKLRANLMEAQRRAEELYIAGDDSEARLRKISQASAGRSRQSFPRPVSPRPDIGPGRFVAFADGKGPGM